MSSATDFSVSFLCLLLSVFVVRGADAEGSAAGQRDVRSETAVTSLAMTIVVSACVAASVVLMVVCCLFSKRRRQKDVDSLNPDNGISWPLENATSGTGSHVPITPESKAVVSRAEIHELTSFTVQNEISVEPRAEANGPRRLQVGSGDTEADNGQKARGHARLHTDDRTDSQASIETGPRMEAVPLYNNEDDSGPGFTIEGDEDTGLFVGDVLPNGPALKSGRVRRGDRIGSVAICMSNMTLEHAQVLLEFAKLYPIELHLLKQHSLGVAVPTSPASAAAAAESLLPTSFTPDVVLERERSQSALCLPSRDGDADDEGDLMTKTNLERPCSSYNDLPVTKPGELSTRWRYENQPNNGVGPLVASTSAVEENNRKRFEWSSEYTSSGEKEDNQVDDLSETVPRHDGITGGKDLDLTGTVEDPTWSDFKIELPGLDLGSELHPDGVGRFDESDSSAKLKDSAWTAERFSVNSKTSEEMIAGKDRVQEKTEDKQFENDVGVGNIGTLFPSGWESSFETEFGKHQNRVDHTSSLTTDAGFTENWKTTFDPDQNNVDAEIPESWKARFDADANNTEVGLPESWKATFDEDGNNSDVKNLHLARSTHAARVEVDGEVLSPVIDSEQLSDSDEDEIIEIAQLSAKADDKINPIGAEFIESADGHFKSTAVPTERQHSFGFSSTVREVTDIPEGSLQVPLPSSPKITHNGDLDTQAFRDAAELEAISEGEPGIRLVSKLLEQEPELGSESQTVGKGVPAQGLNGPYAVRLGDFKEEAQTETGLTADELQLRGDGSLIAASSASVTQTGAVAEPLQQTPTEVYPGTSKRNSQSSPEKSRSSSIGERIIQFFSPKKSGKGKEKVDEGSSQPTSPVRFEVSTAAAGTLENGHNSTEAELDIVEASGNLEEVALSKESNEKSDELKLKDHPTGEELGMSSLSFKQEHIVQVNGQSHGSDNLSEESFPEEQNLKQDISRRYDGKYETRPKNDGFETNFGRIALNGGNEIEGSQRNKESLHGVNHQEKDLDTNDQPGFVFDGKDFEEFYFGMAFYGKDTDKVDDTALVKEDIQASEKSSKETIEVSLSTENRRVETSNDVEGLKLSKSVDTTLTHFRSDGSKSDSSTVGGTTVEVQRQLAGEVATVHLNGYDHSNTQERPSIDKTQSNENTSTSNLMDTFESFDWSKFTLEPIELPWESASYNNPEPRQNGIHDASDSNETGFIRLETKTEDKNNNVLIQTSDA